MTISNTARAAGPFTGTGANTLFPFSFKVFARSDLLVARTIIATAVESTLVLDVDYTVALNPNQNSSPGGIITLAAPLAVGSSLAATSNLPIQQSLELTNQGGFYPTVINDALDRIVITIQQLAAKVGAGALNVGAAASVAAVLAFIGNVAAGPGASLVGFFQAGINAAIRTVQDKLRERVSALDFYKGEADYAICIQRAYNYLVSTGSGGIIYLPHLPGGWQINTPLNFTNSWVPITIRGSGGSNIPSNRPNDYPYGTVLWGNTGNLVMDLSNRHNIGLEDFVIDTNHASKCPSPSRIGILGARNTTGPDNQNHHFTNIACFMRSTGDAANPSIGHYGYGTELGTYTNCWYFADVGAVYSKSKLYNIASPFTTLLANGVSATCNKMTGCKYVTVSGLGPALRMDSTYDDVLSSTYFYNESALQNFPAVLLTLNNYCLIIDGFQCEGFNTMFECTEALLNTRINGFHISQNGAGPIGKFTAVGTVTDCDFNILEGGASSQYVAYRVTGRDNMRFDNTDFSLNDFGTADIVVGNNATVKNIGFKSALLEPTINISGGDGLFTYMLNGERRFAGKVHSNSRLVLAKGPLTNNSGNAVMSVTVPNQDVSGQIRVNYTLNSSSRSLTKTGQVTISVARQSGGSMVATLVESIAQQSVLTGGAETIAVVFAISTITGGTGGDQFVFLTCLQNSSTGGTAFFHATVEMLSTSLLGTVLTDAQHITVGA